jgi:hypothetical protein
VSEPEHLVRLRSEHSTAYVRQRLAVRSQSYLGDADRHFEFSGTKPFHESDAGERVRQGSRSKAIGLAAESSAKETARAE